jgi:hypothetical protein
MRLDQRHSIQGGMMPTLAIDILALTLDQRAMAPGECVRLMQTILA